MGAQDRERWNRRYSTADVDSMPSEWLVQHEGLIRPRQPNLRALDLACGTGQNSVYLARLGFQVDAWDISDAALERLAARLAGSGESLDVHLREVDLQTASIPAATYDLVLDVNFLERRLLEAMAEALRSDGLLLIRALMRKPVADDRNPAYLFEPGELAAAFPQLQTLEYTEEPASGWAALVARRGPQGLTL
jgi:SAM-dependent methyltransferase